MNWSDTRKPVAPGMRSDEKEWVQSKWAKIRESQRKADKADREWNRMNEAFNDWLDAQSIADPLQRATRKSENLALKDALAVGNWHARNAERHIHDLQLFLKMKEMGLL